MPASAIIGSNVSCRDRVLLIVDGGSDFQHNRELHDTLAWSHHIMSFRETTLIGYKGVKTREAFYMYTWYVCMLMYLSNTWYQVHRTMNNV